MPAPAVPAPPRKHGCPDSERRRARDKWRREAWAERRRNRSQPCLNTHSTEDDDISRLASAGIATTPVGTSPSPQALSSQPASPPLTVSPQPAPPPRKRAKTYTEATRTSSHAAVLAKKRQIPQIDGCCSPPSPMPRSPPSPTPPSQPAIESDDETPLQSEISSVHPCRRRLYRQVGCNRRQ